MLLSPAEPSSQSISAAIGTYILLKTDRQRCYVLKCTYAAICSTYICACVCTCKHTGRQLANTLDRSRFISLWWRFTAKSGLPSIRCKKCAIFHFFNNHSNNIRNSTNLSTLIHTYLWTVFGGRPLCAFLGGLKSNSKSSKRSHSFVVVVDFFILLKLM